MNLAGSVWLASAATMSWPVVLVSVFMILTHTSASEANREASPQSPAAAHRVCNVVALVDIRCSDD
jgi:hypothetical protein